MSKKVKVKKDNSRKPSEMEKVIMQKVKSDEIKMKPKWEFVLASVFAFAGLVAVSVTVTFLFNLVFFLMLKKGPGYGRLSFMLEAFPLWVPILAVVGTLLGTLLLRRYDFSYKKNFLVVVLAFILALVTAGFLIDQLGLNSVWSTRRPMRRFYQQLEEGSENYPSGGVQKKLQNGSGRRFSY